MKFVKISLFVFSLLAVILFLSQNESFAQTYTLVGKQIKGADGQNAQLICTAVKITKQVKITSVTGSNAGFWITNGNYTIKQYWSPNDRTAIGFVINSGTYFVYPNLQNNQSTATVTLTLK